MFDDPKKEKTQKYRDCEVTQFWLQQQNWGSEGGDRAGEIEGLGFKDFFFKTMVTVFSLSPSLFSQTLNSSFTFISKC